jgi:hypothetical protein
MDICFIRSTNRQDQTIVTRQDGMCLSVPIYGPLEPIPHDLAHFVIEMELGLRDGLWGSIAGGAILEGMKVISGRQRPHAKERSQAIQHANRQGILYAAAQDGRAVVCYDSRLCKSGHVRQCAKV